MRRRIAAVTALLLLVSFTGCKSKNVREVDALIKSIGEVTAEKLGEIEVAEKAVEELTEEEKAELDKLDELEDARKRYEAILIEEEIRAIGEVTLEKEDAVKNVRSHYERCEEKVREKVTNLAELEAAEEKLDELAAAEVEGLISAIGEASAENTEAYDTAKTAYDSLSKEVKERVSNASRLTEIGAQMETLRQEKAQAILATMRLNEDAVRGMNFYYPTQMPYYSDVRSFVLPYIGQSDSKTWLCMQCHYTGDDWVFFENITFAVDDERFYKSFNYFDLIRDNEGWKVWEIANFEATAEDISILRAIADSTQTIVRFQGDDYNFDFTVSESDKQAIRDVLTAYDILK
ncbi:MAG: hypothetical protein E7390_05470 [Ruminococcaceae bacterium]|nr:hypothetical protein [Oscillospiraceae bacterium]